MGDELVQCQECNNCSFFHGKIDSFGTCENPKARAGQNQDTVTKMHWCPAWEGEAPEKITTIDQSLRMR